MKSIVTLFASISFIGLTSAFGWAQATAPAATDPLDLNPATNCMEALFDGAQPAEERTVLAEAIVESLRGGHCLRLTHAVIQGDLDLRTLPVNGVNGTGGELIPLQGFVVTQSVFEGNVTAASTVTAQVHFAGPVVFDETRFANLDLTEASFGQTVSFQGAVFGGSAKFDRARMDRNASFAKAQFEKPLFFSRVQVQQDLDFSGAEFLSLVRAFGVQAGHVKLQSARFSTTTDLSAWHVQTLDAQKSHFDKVEFKNGEWAGPVAFDQAKFAGNADFSAVRFGDSASFQQIRFEKNATFTKAQFLGPANFNQGVFQLSAIFHQASFFGPALFNRTSFQFLARLSDIRFLGWVDFGQAKFEEVDLENTTFLPPAPNWKDASINGPIATVGLSSHAQWAETPPGLQAALAQSDYFLNRDQENARKAMQRWAMIGLVGLVAGVAALLALQLL